jgi:hypothetical protein
MAKSSDYRLKILAAGKGANTLDVRAFSIYKRFRDVILVAS